MTAMPSTPRDRTAFATLTRLGIEAGFALDGARVRRTSSRFCFGVEHGDYNGTALLGVGTDRFLWLAYAPNDRGALRLFSGNFPTGGPVDVDPRHPVPPEALRGWSRYAHGAAAILTREGFAIRCGLDIALFGDIPGGGMSRSASLCVNLVLTLLEANGHEVADRFRIVELAQAIETDFVGSPCGVLDQTMILFARAGHATHFDPATRAITHLPLGASAPPFRLLALDTGTVRPGLEQSTYTVRRAECEELVRLVNGMGIAIRNLAGIRDDDQKAAIERRFGASHPQLVARLEYLFHAQRRFADLQRAWTAGDLASLGAAFRADGIGLRDLYRISGPELETMCDLARSVPGCFGERMLGGGDKGAAGAIVSAEAVARVRDAVAIGYPRAHPTCAGRFAVHELDLVDGVTVFERMD